MSLGQCANTFVSTKHHKHGNGFPFVGLLDQQINTKLLPILVGEEHQQGH